MGKEQPTRACHEALTGGHVSSGVHFGVEVHASRGLRVGWPGRCEACSSCGGRARAGAPRRGVHDGPLRQGGARWAVVAISSRPRRRPVLLRARRRCAELADHATVGMWPWAGARGGGVPPHVRCGHPT